MNQMKELRKQLKNVVKEVLPEVLNEALVQELYKKLTETLQLQLDRVGKDVRTTLETIDQRSKDSLGYLVRQATTVAPPSVLDNTPPTPPEEEGTDEEPEGAPESDPQS
jgi:hypothetical protein